MKGSFYLAVQYILKRKLRFVFLSVSIITGVAALFVLLTVQDGTRQLLTSKAVASIGVNEIMVRPSYRNGLLMVNKEEKKEITADTITDIKQIPGVKEVYPNVVLKLPTSIQVQIFSNTFESDAPVFGVAPELVLPDLKDRDAFSDQQQDFVPVVISRDLVDFYNAGFADSLGQPKINEEFLIGRDFKLSLGYSSFTGFRGSNVKEVTAKIVGLSGKVPLVGVSIPLKKVEQYSAEFDRGEGKMTSLFVITDSPTDVQSVSSAIENMGFDPDSLQKRIAGVNDNLKALSLILGIISVVILLSSAISIFNTLFSDVVESTSLIGLLRSVGATRGFIRLLFCAKALIVSLISGIIGVVIGWIVVLIIDKLLLTQLSFFAGLEEHILIPSWIVVGFTVLFSLILGIVATLYPAYYASKLDPAESLRY